MNRTSPRTRRFWPAPLRIAFALLRSCIGKNLGGRPPFPPRMGCAPATPACIPWRPACKAAQEGVRRQRFGSPHRRSAAEPPRSPAGLFRLDIGLHSAGHPPSPVLRGKVAAAPRPLSVCRVGQNRGPPRWSALPDGLGALVGVLRREPLRMPAGQLGLDTGTSLRDPAKPVLPGEGGWSPANPACMGGGQNARPLRWGCAARQSGSPRRRWRF
jgi:hypothetical protein